MTLMMKHAMHVLAKSLIIATIVLASSVYAVAASEITGSLSSDGSTDTNNNRTTIVNRTSEEHTLGGTVVAGVSDNQDTTAIPSNIIVWSIVALGLAVAVSYQIGRRSV